MTGSSILWINWAGYCRLAAWAGVITLAMAVVCDRMSQAMGRKSVMLYTLEGVGSLVFGTLDLVLRVTGSYFSLVDGNLGDDGAVLGVCMTTLGNKAWGLTVSGRRIGHSTERFCVCVG